VGSDSSRSYPPVAGDPPEDDRGDGRERPRERPRREDPEHEQSEGDEDGRGGALDQADGEVRPDALADDRVDAGPEAEGGDDAGEHRQRRVRDGDGEVDRQRLGLVAELGEQDADEARGDAPVGADAVALDVLSGRRIRRD
jgi:hypothetical protein